MVQTRFESSFCKRFKGFSHDSGSSCPRNLGLASVCNVKDVLDQMLDRKIQKRVPRRYGKKPLTRSSANFNLKEPFLLRA